MIVLNANNLKKEYGAQLIFEEASFQLHRDDKLGVVGPNGAGKTTLFKVLTGEERAASGQVQIPGDVEIGYLKQNQGFDSNRTIREEIENIFKPLRDMEEELESLASKIPEAEEKEQLKLIEKQEQLRELFERRGGYTYRSEMRGILSSMAFLEDDFDRRIESLSGGEKTRLALALLLLKKPDLLLMDEPTNHLDIGTLQWLEQYLQSYKGSLMVISHDRFFLDQICDRTLEVASGKVKMFEGNYSYYAKRKKEIREEELKRYKATQKEIAKQEELIRKYKERGTEKLAKRAVSREKMLEKMEKVEAPDMSNANMKIEFKERFKSGNDVLYMEEVSKSFGSGQDKKLLFEHVNMDVKRGDRICIVGANGIGKTTLLKLILGRLEPDTGRIDKGYNIEIDYYDQEQKLLRDENTVLEEVHSEFRNYTATQVRSMLGRFLFRGEDAFLEVKNLSGGERARLSLLKLMMRGGNLLLLDEPTNHLDIESREVFEDALLDFPGTVIVISHDRYFLNKIPTKIMELGREGFTTFLGKYDYYSEKKQELSKSNKYLETLKKQQDLSDSEELETAEKIEKNKLNAAEERRQQKKEEAKKRKAERDKKALELEITDLEDDIGRIEEDMCKPEVQEDISKLRELGEELEKSKNALEEAYEKWLQYE